MKKVLYLLGFVVVGIALLTPGLAQTQNTAPPSSMQTVEKPPCGCPVKKQNGEKKVYKHHVKWHLLKTGCPTKGCPVKETTKPCPCPSKQ